MPHSNAVKPDPTARINRPWTSAIPSARALCSKREPGSQPRSEISLACGGTIWQNIDDDQFTGKSLEPRCETRLSLFQRACFRSGGLGGAADSNFQRKRLIPGLSHRGVFRDRSAFLSPAACSFRLNLCRAMLGSPGNEIVRRVTEIEKDIKSNRMSHEIVELAVRFFLKEDSKRI